MRYDREPRGLMVRWRQKFQVMQTAQATRNRGLLPCSCESCSLVVGSFFFLNQSRYDAIMGSQMGGRELKGDLLQSSLVTTWSNLRLEAALVTRIRSP
jgi:hypothetical protein